MDGEEVLNRLIEEAKNDPNILGFFLSGSRGKGFATKYSDYDVIVIIKDKVAKKYKIKYKRRKIEKFGFTIFSFSEFKKHAKIGTPSEWDMPSYLHLKAIIDKNGKIQKLIDEKGRIPKSKIKDYVSGYLDGYINYVYRSLKCFRDGNIVCARLEAAKTIELFLRIIFGLEGRVVPFYKYLEWELKNYPLRKFPTKPRELIKALLKILESGDIRSQQKLFKAIEKVFRKEGYRHVFDSWDSKAIEFIKSFRIKC